MDTTLIGSDVQVICQAGDNIEQKSIPRPPYTFTMVKQPGNDAFSHPWHHGAGSGGFSQARLFTGTTPGFLIVAVETYGLRDQVSLQILPEAPR
jgi:hypothetical protein